ncbi:hypothetical protein [Actinokineospora enzanensis]|uniref:hypothetical protein n=1 Tax=Actinokineospora enzanensis TaxID=155975 RepID=UPI0012EC73A7|nr:hypothetical protein [Actinokineospora enzanensis]
MSNPGGPYWQEPYQVDPLTGKPVSYQPPQPTGYQGFGMYDPPPPPRPPRNRTPLVVGLALAVVVAIGAVVTVVLVNRDDSDQVADPPPTTRTVDPPRSVTKPPTTTRKPGKTPTTTPAEPAVPGWQPVQSDREHAGYDVPKDWEIATPDTIVGFEDNDGKPTAVMHDVATYKPEACPNSRGSYRGHTGFVSAGTVDPQRAAVNGVRLFAEAAALNKDGSKAPVSTADPTPVKVADGKVDAVLATATLTVNEPGDCPSPTVSFTAVAFTNGSQTTLFMMYLDQGVPDALPNDVAARVVSSLRPITG